MASCLVAPAPFHLGKNRLAKHVVQVVKKKVVKKVPRRRKENYGKLNC